MHVLPGAIDGETRVAVVYAEREFVPPQVRAFVDAVAAWAPAQCEDLRQSGPQATRKRAAKRKAA